MIIVLHSSRALKALYGDVKRCAEFHAYGLGVKVWAKMNVLVRDLTTCYVVQ